MYHIHRVVHKAYIAGPHTTYILVYSVYTSISVHEAYSGCHLYNTCPIYHVGWSALVYYFCLRYYKVVRVPRPNIISVYVINYHLYNIYLMLPQL